MIIPALAFSFHTLFKPEVVGLALPVGDLALFHTTPSLPLLVVLLLGVIIGLLALGLILPGTLLPLLGGRGGFPSLGGLGGNHFLDCAIILASSTLLADCNGITQLFDTTSHFELSID